MVTEDVSRNPGTEDVEGRGTARRTGSSLSLRTTMTDLKQLAETDDTEVVLAKEAHGLYRIEGTETAEADDVSPEGEFPKFGRYLAVTAIDRDGAEKGPRLLEVPRGLAVALVEAGLDETGAEIWVRNVAKDVEGAWVFDVAPAETAPGWSGDDP